MQTAFYPSLGELCTKYLVKRNPGLPPHELAQFFSKIADEQKQLFEQFLLFDTLAIRIREDNLPLPLLLRFFGEHGLEELIEHGALRFLQWRPTILHMVTDTPGVNALAYGDMKSAYTSGKLSKLGLPPVEPITNMPKEKRGRMNSCASEAMDYSYVMDKGMTSLTNYAFFSLLDDSREKLKARPDMVGAFNELAKVEDFPDLKALFPQLADPLKQVPKLRAKASSIKFRKWLAEATEGNAELSATYVASIADVKGPFATPKGKFGALMGRTRMRLCLRRSVKTRKIERPAADFLQ
jgi:hypothetical protein